MVVATVYSVLSSTALQCLVLSYNTVDVSDVTYGEYEYPRTGSRAPFLSVKVGGLSPPTFESGGAWLPPLYLRPCLSSTAIVSQRFVYTAT